MKLAIIGGKWDDQFGRESGVVRKLSAQFDQLCTVSVFNGGNFKLLEQNVLEKAARYHDVVLWFPDIPNDKPKLVEQIKKINPKTLLVISKNNRQGKYDRLSLIARALDAKANLLVEMTENDSLIAMTVIDPLGNVFINQSTEIEQTSLAIYNRLNQLGSFTRVPSRSIGNAIAAPDQNEFFELVRQYADKFHTLTHAVNQNRLIGNTSFRCEKGFPSFKDGELIFVSRRNIDKRDITSAGFVAVDPSMKDGVIEYYGEIKPSVDTPIQIKLYQQYPNVNYMLHAHVYIEDAPFTNSIIPCGALEEFDEICELFPSTDSQNFAVNLRGHGSLILANNVDYLRCIKYTRRI